ncbi:Bifunctional protein FolD protein [Methyloligella halotolerans]|uniref:Bifunctional protein FolD n=1 Tax=Methyloligella halotolerans TaxID=1177755 RepID=A0A1E2RZW3_9HYPH|nr:bifunctional methylenetetrahydrofolate dehydrogenase/methenyltetrahydrofolate cyclohydrolase FolD [Methyloligella halotolerans]ODA67700.1 Bifunctional protein FolD protein [Methyloligella halotolerans]
MTVQHTAEIIDGNAIAAKIRGGLKARVDKLVAAAGWRPTLAVIRVGEDPASIVYVGRKVRACEEAGIDSRQYVFPADVSQEEVIATVRELSAAPDVHGILVQLPLPKHIALAPVLGAISVEKDVDGFHLYNVGGLVIGDTVFPPCTPHGVMLLLDAAGVEISGKNAVVVGASNIVGKPMALMLMQREATVSICHIKTRDLAQYTILADILILAAGSPKLVVGPMVKRGAVVVDVGINRMPDGKLVGDCDFETVKERASLLTPVPGGVGPMTVTMLLANTVKSAERHFQREKGQAERIGEPEPV